MIGEKIYWEMVAEIERDNPSEPLLPKLQERFGPVQQVYIKLAYPRKGDTTDVANELPEDQEQDEYAIGLTREIREGYNLIRATHNKYHECKTDAEFQNTAKAMQRAWEAVLKAIAKRKHYQLTGHRDETETELPDNPVALAKKQASIRVQVSQTRAAIREMVKNGQNDGMEAKEEKLQALLRQEGLVKQKLATFEA